MFFQWHFVNICCKSNTAIYLVIFWRNNKLLLSLLLCCFFLVTSVSECFILRMMCVCLFFTFKNNIFKNCKWLSIFQISCSIRQLNIKHQFVVVPDCEWVIESFKWKHFNIPNVAYFFLKTVFHLSKNHRIWICLITFIKWDCKNATTNMKNNKMKIWSQHIAKWYCENLSMPEWNDEKPNNILIISMPLWLKLS